MDYTKMLTYTSLDDFHSLKKIIKRSNETNMIPKIIDVIKMAKVDVILLDHYLIIYKLGNESNVDYINYFFCKLFIELYRILPNTIISLFIELPNFHFFSKILEYIELNNNNDPILHKLSKILCSFFIYQLKKDIDSVSISYKNKITPILSDAPYFSPINETIGSYIANNIFNYSNKKKNLVKYKNLLVELSHNITLLIQNDSNYEYDNYIDIENIHKLCLKKFKENFSKEINTPSNIKQTEFQKKIKFCICIDNNK